MVGMTYSSMDGQSLIDMCPHEVIWNVGELPDTSKVLRGSSYHSESWLLEQPFDPSCRV